MTVSRSRTSALVIEMLISVYTVLRRVFNLIDYDENEEITLVEFLSALHVNPEIGTLLDEGTSAGEDVSQIVSEVFSRMDADQNKSVSFDEFVQYFTAR